MRGAKVCYQGLQFSRKAFSLSRTLSCLAVPDPVQTISCNLACNASSFLKFHFYLCYYHYYYITSAYNNWKYIKIEYNFA